MMFALPLVVYSNTSISWFMMFSNEASHTIVASPDVLVLVGVFWQAVSPEIIRADRAIVRRIILWFT